MTNFVVEREGVLQFRRRSFVGIAISGTQGCYYLLTFSVLMVPEEAVLCQVLHPN